MNRLISLALGFLLLLAMVQAFDGWHDFFNGDGYDWHHAIPSDGLDLGNGQTYYNYDDLHNSGFVPGYHGDGDHGDGDFGSGGSGDGDDGDGYHGISDAGSGIDHSFDGSGGIDYDIDSEHKQPVFPNTNKGCAKGCAKCFFGMCRRCQKGFRKTMFMTCIKRKNACRQIPHCKDCSGIAWLKSCKRCEKGWYKHTGEFDVKAQCVKRCPRGYQGKNSKKGSFCKKVIPEGCMDQYCSMCKKGWYIVIKNGNHKCHKQCPAGYYPMGKSYCIKCKRGCAKCSSALKCDACSKRLSLYKRNYSWGAVISTRCLKRCPRGYKKELVKGKGSVCRQVCLVANCQRCSKNGHSGLHHHCDSCKPGYHLLFGLNDRCVKKCPTGYYQQKTHIGMICRRGPKPTTSTETEIKTKEPETTTHTTPKVEIATTSTPETTTMSPDWSTPQIDETTTNSELTTTEPEATTTEPELTTTPKPPGTQSETTTTEPEMTTMTNEPTTKTETTEPDILSMAPALKVFGWR